MLLVSMLSPVVRTGRLTIIDGGPGPSATIRLCDPSLHWKLVLRPRLYVPEAYMDGTLTIEEGSLYDFLELLVSNDTAHPNELMRLGRAAARLGRRMYQLNPVWRARRNVAHHYDLSDQLYELFLDRDRQYSCAYFRTPEDDLDTAQENKKRHIGAKLLLRPGQKVLDIGSGWGGLALYLAGECDVEVTGLTLSEEQLKVAQRRAAVAGLADRVRFHLRDYRQETGTYDRIVSVGMFEHVGVNHYQAFFAKLKALLAPDGVALLHSIGRMGAIRRRCPRWCPSSSGPGSGSPILRSFGCITPRRCGNGGAVSSRTATASARSMTSASVGCGKPIWSARNSPSGTPGIWCSRCSWRIASMPCR